MARVKLPLPARRPVTPATHPKVARTHRMIDAHPLHAVPRAGTEAADAVIAERARSASDRGQAAQEWEMAAMLPVLEKVLARDSRWALLLTNSFPDVVDAIASWLGPHRVLPLASTTLEVLF